MKYELLMECRAGTRHAFKTIMIIALPDGTFKLHKVCSQCGSLKFPIWDKRGRILKSPTYKHSAQYREFLNSHDPAEARVAILTSDIKKVEAPRAKNNPRLRLVSGTKAKRSHLKSHAPVRKAR